LWLVLLAMPVQVTKHNIFHCNVTPVLGGFSSDWRCSETGVDFNYCRCKNLDFAQY